GPGAHVDPRARLRTAMHAAEALDAGIVGRAVAVRAIGGCERRTDAAARRARVAHRALPSLGATRPVRGPGPRPAPEGRVAALAPVAQLAVVADERRTALAPEPRAAELVAVADVAVVALPLEPAEPDDAHVRVADQIDRRQTRVERTDVVVARARRV